MQIDENPSPASLGSPAQARTERQRRRLSTERYGSADGRDCFEVRVFAAAFLTAGALAASAAATSQVARREADCPPPIYLSFRAGTCPAWKKVLLHQVKPSHGLVCCGFERWMQNPTLCSERTVSAAAAALQTLLGGCCGSSSLGKIRAGPTSGADKEAISKRQREAPSNPRQTLPV